MQIARGRRSDAPSELRTSTFTGTVCLDPVMAVPGISVNTVMFLPGARTFWHRHPGGQLLVVSAGQGLVVTRDRTIVAQPGDTIWTDPDEEHWHGGGLATCMAHLAISHGTTDWHGEVSDDEVTAALARA